ncbi:MAG: 16S rRNA (guanine(966)-N(2))-methyltransferase RsmD [Acidimicrobiales bacterium]|nr:16S rRNA (guanine(966)-N(2))-methyltransferase RsmD [Acidimicrobiales bacterium]
MRVVAGDARGRPLQTPPGLTTRPTSDRVRESVFNMLYSLHVVEDANVLDLYAGCGALGIEALSRGASHATFVEQDRRAVQSIEKNLAALAMSSRATVIRADVLGWIAATQTEFDLALVDPPYALDNWEEILSGVDARMIVAESNGHLQETKGWDVVRDKEYGTTVITVLRRTGDCL